MAEKMLATDETLARLVDAVSAGGAAVTAAAQAQAALAGVNEAIENIPAGATPIVNDLSTGGATMALSAEQGKVLGNKQKWQTNPNLLDNWYFAGAEIWARAGCNYYKAGGTFIGTLSADTKTITLKPDINWTYIDLVDNEGTYYEVATADCYQKSGTFPINQRGAATYNTNSATLDRWNGKSGGPIVITHDGVQVTASQEDSHYFRQLLDPITLDEIKGRTVTGSALIPGGANTRLCSLVLWIPEAPGYQKINGISVGNGMYSFTGIPSQRATGGEFRIEVSDAQVNSGSALAKAVKLELGSEQTLAHQENGAWVLNEVPNYAEELAKCQRYFFKYHGIFPIPKFSNGECYGNVFFPTTMRIAPVISDIAYNWDWGVPDVSSITADSVTFHHSNTSPIINGFIASAEL